MNSCVSQSAWFELEGQSPARFNVGRARAEGWERPPTAREPNIVAVGLRLYA